MKKKETFFFMAVVLFINITCLPVDLAREAVISS